MQAAAVRQSRSLKRIIVDALQRERLLLGATIGASLTAALGQGIGDVRVESGRHSCVAAITIAGGEERSACGVQRRSEEHEQEPDGAITVAASGLESDGGFVARCEEGERRHIHVAVDRRTTRVQHSCTD